MQTFDGTRQVQGIVWIYSAAFVIIHFVEIGTAHSFQ